MIVKEYMEEFYKLTIRSRYSEEGNEAMARYINGLKYETQYDLSIIRIRNFFESYQLSLKVKDKLERR